MADIAFMVGMASGVGTISAVEAASVGEEDSEVADVSRLTPGSRHEDRAGLGQGAGYISKK